MSVLVADDMKNEVRNLESLNEDLDQIASLARSCETVAPRAKAFLDMAWYFTEQAMRDSVSGSCGHIAIAKGCECCRHYDALSLQAERMRRLL